MCGKQCSNFQCLIDGRRDNKGVTAKSL